VTPADPNRGSASRFEAWHWLIANAAYAQRVWNNKGRRQILQAGQLVAGRAFLAHTWNWSDKTVRVFLKHLFDEHMITLATDEIRGQQRGNTANIVTLCNYLKYQLWQDGAQGHEGPANGQQRATEGPARGHIENKDTNKQLEEIRAAGAAPEVLDSFAVFWREYPEGRKKATGKTREVFSDIVLGRGKYAGRPVAADVLITAVRAYAATKPDPKYVPMPLTWLSQGRWEDPAKLHPDPVEGMDWGWWRQDGKADRLRTMPTESWRKAFASRPPNGQWPWEYFGPPPGHPECFVPAEIVAEKNWAEIYRGSVTYD
jgi:hypothetical protein